MPKASLEETPQILDQSDLAFPVAFDLYQRVVSDGDQLASGLAQLIRSTGAKRVLDCAAGSGLPALQLRQQGLDVTCSDGDLTMVKRFQYNARLLGVSDECRLVDWADLDPDDGLYDYVMCRGNSLAYAKSWNGGSRVADVDCLSRYLKKFASVMKPGGHLQLDAPRELASARYEGSAHVIDPAVEPLLYDWKGSALEIVVQEQVSPLEHSRRWECSISVQPTEGPVSKLDFVRHSSMVTIEQLRHLLEKNDFKTRDIVQVAGDRDCHATILATRR